jgi:transposase
MPLAPRAQPTHKEVLAVIFVGIDWAEEAHAICVLDEQGAVVAREQIPDSAQGVSDLQTLLATQTDDPADVVIGIETDRGLVVRALLAAGYQLYAINPLSTNRYRDRHSTSRKKSDPGDAKVLADVVRTDRHNHEKVTSNSDEVEALQVLTRMQQRLIWDRQRHVNQLRSTLREFYPGALDALGNDLAAPEALALLARAPTPLRARSLSRQQIIGMLQRAGRERNLEKKATEIQSALRAPQLELPTLVADAYAQTVSAAVRVIAEVGTQIRSMEEALTEQFKDHPDAELILSLPGLGTVLGARVLAEFGDDPTRYVDSKARKCYAGTAPITRASGMRRSVHRRNTSNSWLANGCHQWAFCALTKSAGAKRYYRQLRDRGKTHNQALRSLSNRLVGILHGCLRYRTLYDEQIAWPELTVIQEQREPADYSKKPIKSTEDQRGSHKLTTTTA